MKYELLEGFHTLLPADAKVFTPEHLYKLEIGDFVKVGVKCANGRTERFWARITQLVPTIKASVNQDLYLTPLHGLKDESPLELEPKHIVAYMR